VKFEISEVFDEIEIFGLKRVKGSKLMKCESKIREFKI